MAKKERFELKLTVKHGDNWRTYDRGSVDNREGARAKARNLQEREAKDGKLARVTINHFVGARSTEPVDTEDVDFLPQAELDALDAQGAAEDAAAVQESLRLPLVEVTEHGGGSRDCNICPWTDRDRKRPVRQVAFRTGTAGHSWYSMTLCDGHYNALVAQLAAAKD
jgi:hypothetical protein